MNILKGNQMAIREYWIYQQRDVLTPWAIYIVHEFDRRNPKATRIDWTLYHEDIPNQTHSKSFIGLHYSTIVGYVQDITEEMSFYVTVTEQDTAQIEKALSRILI